MTLATARVRVRYAETDQMGVAHHGNYFAWFEVGRTHLLRELGFCYRDLERQGIRLPVIETHVRYLQPAYYDDELEIQTRLSLKSGARLSFAYEVHRVGSAEAPTPLTTALTEHAAVDPRGRPRRLPAELRSRLS